MSQTIQLRRGSDSSRSTITLNQGEPAWTTDTKRLYIGDGSTVGGILMNPVTGSLLLNSANILTGVTSTLVTGNENRFVHTTGTENIDGDKRFTSSIGIHVSGLRNAMLAGDITVDPVNYELLDSQPVASVNWNTYVLYENANVSLNWFTKVLSGGWQIATASIPASSTSAGTKGMMTVSGSNLLVCTGTNMWAKLALTSY